MLLVTSSQAMNDSGRTRSSALAVDAAAVRAAGDPFGAESTIAEEHPGPAEAGRDPQAERRIMDGCPRRARLRC